MLLPTTNIIHRCPVCNQVVHFSIYQADGNWYHARCYQSALEKAHAEIAELRKEVEHLERVIELEGG